MIKLTRSDPSKNMHRFYALQLAPTLFGEWGRIGSPGTVQQNVFHSADLAQAALTKRQNRQNQAGLPAVACAIGPTFLGCSGTPC